jgi:hypothetical protein
VEDGDGDEEEDIDSLFSMKGFQVNSYNFTGQSKKAKHGNK